MEAKQYLIEICPFCGNKHEVNHVTDIICDCGARFYIFDGFWLNRQSKNKVCLSIQDRIALQNWMLANCVYRK